MKKKVPFIAAYWWCMLLFVLGVSVLFLGNHDGGVSESENRTLQAFPHFSFKSWFDGTFSGELEAYLSDQMPGRDPILKTSNRILGLFDATSEKDRILDQGMIEALDEMANGHEEEPEEEDSVVAEITETAATPVPLPETPTPEATPASDPFATPAPTPVDPAVKDTSMVRRFSLKRTDGRLSTQFQFGKDAIEQLDRDNPLANSASFQIYLYDAANQSAFVNHLKTLPQFRRIRYAAETAEVMANISRVITMGGLVLILLLVGIAILLISNTIKLSVYVRRNEVEIMKYIGATDAFVRTPFVVEGIIIGILGAILPALLIYFTYEALLALIVQQFTTSFSHMIHFMDTKSIMLGLAPIFLGVGIVVGVLGSLFSMQRYLKV